MNFFNSLLLTSLVIGGGSLFARDCHGKCGKKKQAVAAHALMHHRAVQQRPAAVRALMHHRAVQQRPVAIRALQPIQPVKQDDAARNARKLVLANARWAYNDYRMGGARHANRGHHGRKHHARKHHARGNHIHGQAQAVPQKPANKPAQQQPVKHAHVRKHNGNCANGICRK